MEDLIRITEVIQDTINRKEHISIYLNTLIIALSNVLHASTDAEVEATKELLHMLKPFLDQDARVEAICHKCLNLLNTNHTRINVTSQTQRQFVDTLIFYAQSKRPKLLQLSLNTLQLVLDSLFQPFTSWCGALANIGPRLSSEVLKEQEHVFRAALDSETPDDDRPKLRDFLSTLDTLEGTYDRAAHLLPEVKMQASLIPGSSKSVLTLVGIRACEKIFNGQSLDVEIDAHLVNNDLPNLLDDAAPKPLPVHFKGNLTSNLAPCTINTRSVTPPVKHNRSRSKTNGQLHYSTPPERFRGEALSVAHEKLERSNLTALPESTEAVSMTNVFNIWFEFNDSNSRRTTLSGSFSMSSRSRNFNPYHEALIKALDFLGEEDELYQGLLAAKYHRDTWIYQLYLTLFIRRACIAHMNFFENYERLHDLLLLVARYTESLRAILAKSSLHLVQELVVCAFEAKCSRVLDIATKHLLSPCLKKAADGGGSSAITETAIKAFDAICGNGTEASCLYSIRCLIPLSLKHAAMRYHLLRALNGLVERTGSRMTQVGDVGTLISFGVRCLDDPLAMNRNQASQYCTSLLLHIGSLNRSVPKISTKVTPEDWKKLLAFQCAADQ